MQTQKKVLILIADSNGAYPVPAVKGGAVTTLIEHLVKENNDKQLVDLTIMSVYDKQAESSALDKYPNVRFIWVKRSTLIKALDGIVMNAVKTLFPGKKLLSYMSITTLLCYIWQASRLLKREFFDKVILQNNMPLAWVIKLSNYKGEYFYHLHNTPRTNAKCLPVFNRCKAYLCVSKSVENEISNPTNPIGPVPQNKIRILYNCIDTNLFREKEINRKIWQDRFGIKENERIIIYVGRLSEEKGIDQLLLSLDYIKTKNLKLLIVGSLMSSNSMKDAYQEKIKKLAEKFDDRVVFTGYISQQELPDIYNLAEISVLPSMWDEPAGLTMIESLACGTPVITTRSGGIPEYVEGGAIILERSPKLPLEIAKSIDMVFSDAKLYQQIRLEGINRVKNNFASDFYLNRFLESIV